MFLEPTAGDVVGGAQRGFVAGTKAKMLFAGRFARAQGLFEGALKTVAFRPEPLEAAAVIFGGRGRGGANIPKPPEMVASFVERAAPVRQWEGRLFATEGLETSHEIGADALEMGVLERHPFLRVVGFTPRVFHAADPLGRLGGAPTRLVEARAGPRQRIDRARVIRTQGVALGVGRPDQTLGFVPLGFETDALPLEPRPLRTESVLFPRSRRVRAFERRDLAIGFVVPSALFLEKILGRMAPFLELLKRGVEARPLGGERFERQAGLVAGTDEPFAVLEESAATKGAQTRVESPLFVAQSRVALGRARLTCEAEGPCVDFSCQILETRQIIARALDPRGGLASAFAILGDPRGFFEEGPELLGARFDETADRPLLDDRVVVRAQAGPQKDPDDVASAAGTAVQAVVRDAVATHRAPDGDLGVARVFAPQRPVAVVKNELDEGRHARLAPGGAVEDDIRHRGSAQCLGGTLAHDPADGVDEVRFARPVRARDGDHTRPQVEGRRVGEGLEASESDGQKAHGVAAGVR